MKGEKIVRNFVEFMEDCRQNCKLRNDTRICIRDDFDFVIIELGNYYVAIPNCYSLADFGINCKIDATWPNRKYKYAGYDTYLLKPPL